MYACLHAASSTSSGEALLQLAREFSPSVEQTSPDTVVFSVTPLRKLMGSLHQIASEICRFGYERKLQASLAMAPNPDTAILLARNCLGVTLVAPGEERMKLAPLPCTCLFSHGLAVDPGLAQVLQRWGVKTCEELAALPEKGVAERLGKAGVYLRDLACGHIHRPLRLPPPKSRMKSGWNWNTRFRCWSRYCSYSLASCTTSVRVCAPSPRRREYWKPGLNSKSTKTTAVNWNSRFRSTTTRAS